LLFTEPTFLFLFLPVLLALYFATFSREHREYGNVLLLIASVIFYAKGGGSFTWLMLASISFNYLMGIAVDRARASGQAKTVLAGKGRKIEREQNRQEQKEKCRFSEQQR